MKPWPKCWPRGRSWCRASSWWPFSMDNSPDEHLHPDDILAIEVYDGASRIPPEYPAGSAACGVVVIWTKRAGQ